MVYPKLDKIPHVISLSHPLHDIESTWRRGVFEHPNFKKFTVISCEPNNLNTTLDFSNVVGTPYVSELHLHSGHPKLQESFNRDIAKGKSILALFPHD